MAGPSFATIPGYGLTRPATTLATEWDRPVGDYPVALWPSSKLRRVTPEPTGWLIVEEHFHRDDEYGGTHSILARSDKQERVFQSTAWSGHHTIGDVELWSDGRFNDGLTVGNDPAAPDLRFFTQVRQHHQLVMPTFEVTPTFLWYWDAFPTADGWLYLNAAGRDVELIRIDISMDEWCVEVSALELRTFLADTGLELLVQMDYTTTLDHDAFPRVDQEFRSDGAYFTWFAMHDRSISGRDAFSNVMGKYLVPGVKTVRRRRGEERGGHKSYLEFIYDIDPTHGSVLAHTCDPAQLGNYRDSSRLHELTPVYFTREVLSRYASEPARYQVTGCRITCLDLWGLDISTNTAGLIEVYLGELGSLPAQEQSHWLAYNVPPEGEMEEGRFRRDFLNQIAASEDPVRDLHRAKATAMEATRALLGAPLWKELDPQTQGEFDRLVGPTTTDVSALGPPILTLSKALVDGIEPAPLKAFLGDAQKDEKSLALLGRFLERLGDSDDSIEPFRALQGFRSAGGVAHLGGSKALAARDRLGIQGLAPWPAFVQVVQRLTQSLERISALAVATNSEQ